MAQKNDTLETPIQFIIDKSVKGMRGFIIQVMYPDEKVEKLKNEE